MNKKHRCKGLIAVLLIVAMLFSTGAGVVSAGATPVEVSTYEGLVQAITEAKDGDIIGIKELINIPYKAVLGDAGKRITLRKVNQNGELYFTGADFDESYTEISNIIFDGNNIAHFSPFLSVYQQIRFTNSEFINCNTNTEGGAVGLNRGIVYFTDCLFNGNTARNGAHIFINDGITVNIDNCTFTNGTVTEDGGAIFSSGSNTSCNISNSTITENSSNDAGGGIANNHSKFIVDETKIYNNTAINGGADIASAGTFIFSQDLKILTELYSDTDYIPLGWVDDSNGVSTGYTNCWKLSYEIKQEETPVEPVDPPADPDPTEPADPPVDPTPTDPEDPKEENPEPPVEEQPTEPTTPEEKPTEPENPPKEDPTIPETPPEDQQPPKDEGNDKEDTPATPPTSKDEPNSTVNNSTSTSTTNNHTSTDRSSNESNDNTRVTENSNNSSTVNHYYTTEVKQQEIDREAVGGSYTVSNQSTATNATYSGETPTEANRATAESVITNSLSGNIKIDAKGIDLIFEVTDEGYNISITANQQEAEKVETLPAMATPQSEENNKKEIDWMQIITIILLSGVLVLQLKKSKKE